MLDSLACSVSPTPVSWLLTRVFWLREVKLMVAVGRKIVGHFKHYVLAYACASDALASDVIPFVTVLQRLLTKETDEDYGMKTMKGTLATVVKRHFTDMEKTHSTALQLYSF